MVTIRPLSPDARQRWDHFVTTAKNGHFMFLRDYMDYHGDRIRDHSLLFEKEGKLVGLLPAHLVEESNGAGLDLVSHAGLSFGGVISSRKMNVSLMLELFSSLCQYMRKNRWRNLIYVPSPYIYHRYPAEEDLYALASHSAAVVSTRATCAHHVGLSPALNDARRRICRKASELGISVKPLHDIGTFYNMVCRLLDVRHGAKPVHSLEEIRYLAERFPENIKMLGAWRKSELLAGKMIFETATCCKLQYVGSTDSGMECGATDLINEYLLKQHCPAGKWLDFGTSHDPATGRLNHQLVGHKESFGARVVLIRTYRLPIT